MKSIIQTPKVNYLNAPFIECFTEVEKENTEIIIGNSNKIDDIFCATDESAEYIRCLCSIIPKAEFRNVRISARYRTMITDDDAQEKTMSFQPYSGKNIGMNGFVSELSVRFRDLLPAGEQEAPIKSEWIEFLRSNPDIFTKSFNKQEVDSEIESISDQEEYGPSDIVHVKSKCHFFAGSYYPGIHLPDIQQYLFYIGTALQAHEYINIISARDLVTSGIHSPAQEVTPQSLSTLVDDISDGKIEINFPDETKYRSVSITKTTLISDIVQILFKKEV
ncbi:MAG: hypothetical protein LBC25_02730 [Holosporales bacterium]|jgi:hypothetical protein|nr:hypothetical protein [Holosporales bacterium]